MFEAQQEALWPWLVKVWNPTDVNLWLLAFVTVLCDITLH